MLEYKAGWYGNEIHRAPTMYPSSQTCSCCGYRNPRIKNLGIRIWECPKCHAVHDVAGVILYATEMQPDQFPPFRAIQKPMVIYDNDLGNEYHCVTFGGVEGIQDCVDYFTGDILLTTLRMEHLERAHVAMLFLEQEMKGAISCKFKSFSTCKIIPGKTVK